MKDDLIGHVVGISMPHRIDPSQVKPGRSLDKERTVWIRLSYHAPAVFRGKCIHTGREYGGRPESIHTIMPEMY